MDEFLNGSEYLVGINFKVARRLVGDGVREVTLEVRAGGAGIEVENGSLDRRGADIEGEAVHEEAPGEEDDFVSE